MTPSIPEAPLCELFSAPAPVPYADALAWQAGRVARRQAGTVPDALLLLEHPPTVTLGRRETGENLLSTPEQFAAQGIDLVSVDRGGEATYHAPGQLVGYPVLDLRFHGQDLHRYLRDLEQVLGDTLGVFGVVGSREPGLTGVWAGGRKVAAIGIKASRWVCMHGFALNIDVDLGPMRRDIIPCGLVGRDVVSLAELLPAQHLTRADVEPVLISAFANVFGVRIEYSAWRETPGLPGV